MYQYITLSIKDRVAVLTFARPESGNAFAKDSYEEVKHAIGSCAENNDVGAVVITGQGVHFSAGGDIKRFKGLIERGEFIGTDSIMRAASMAAAVRACPKPVIAMINGAAAGAGCSLALACDFRVVTPKSKMVMAFIKLGLSGDTGAMYYLHRILGTAKTLELMMLGDVVPGEEAVRLGLATKCVEQEALETETMAFAARLAHGPTFAYARQKELMRRYFYHDMPEYSKDEADYMSACSHTADFAEAVDAFLEKRPAAFQGK